MIFPDKNASRHPVQGVIRRTIERPASSDVAKFAGVPAAFVLDFQGKHGVLPPAILPLSSGMTLCGPAATVLGPDVNLRRMAIDLAQPGDVLVVAAGGRDDRASFGEYTARQMRERGMAGIVLDGATRDARDIRMMNYPIFTRGVTPRNFTYPLAEPGSVNLPIAIGEVVVRPGDLVVGDDDGVVIVPRENVAEMASYIQDAFDADTARRSKDLDKPFGLESSLRQAGYVFVDEEIA